MSNPILKRNYQNQSVNKIYKEGRYNNEISPNHSLTNDLRAFDPIKKVHSMRNISSYDSTDRHRYSTKYGERSYVNIENSPDISINNSVRKQNMQILDLDRKRQEDFNRGKKSRLSRDISYINTTQKAKELPEYPLNIEDAEFFLALHFKSENEKGQNSAVLLNDESLKPFKLGSTIIHPARILEKELARIYGDSTITDDPKAISQTTNKYWSPKGNIYIYI